MRVKIEMAGLISGLVSLLVYVAVLFNKDFLGPDVFELFRGGQIGAQIVFAFVIFAMLSVILFLINVLTGQRQRWGLRLFLVFLFFIAMAFLGSMV